MRKIVEFMVEKILSCLLFGERQPLKTTVTTEEAQSDFFWKSLEVALGASLGLAFHHLLDWSAQSHQWRTFLVVLALWLVNLALSYFNSKRAIDLYDRWQDLVWQDR